MNVSPRLIFGYGHRVGHVAYKLRLTRAASRMPRRRSASTRSVTGVIELYWEHGPGGDQDDATPDGVRYRGARENVGGLMFCIFLAAII